MLTRHINKKSSERFQGLDLLLLIVLTIGLILVVVPFFNVIAVSLTSNKEYLDSAWVIFPKEPTLDAYREIFKDARILVGYKTSLCYVFFGVIISIVLETMLAYALSCKNWVGRRAVLLAVLFTMIFNGGMVPLYLTIKDLRLNGSIWAIIMIYGMDTFYMIMIYNYFSALPESMVESARLDGANEWTILLRIVVPVSTPIMATILLFTIVNLWNEYFYSMLFLRSNNWQSIQQVLRSVIIDSQQMGNRGTAVLGRRKLVFTEGVKMGTVIVAMLPVLCVYPFLQRYFTKGIILGAIKA